MSLSQIFLHELNKIRTNPQSYVEKFEKICEEIKEVKRKKRMYDELLSFIQKLKKAPSVSPLKLSTSFSTVADKRIESIIANQGFENDDFMDIAKANASGFEEIYQIYDKFTDNPSSFFTDLLIDTKDDDKTNRKILFDPNLQYIGINDMENAKKNNIILLVLADDLDHENDIGKDIEQQILEQINIYRCDTKVAATDLNEVIIEARKQKMVPHYLENLENLIEFCTSGNLLAPLSLNDNLNDLAAGLLENPEHTLNKKSLETFAKTRIRNFGHLYGFIFNDGEDDAESIVKYSLTSKDENNNHQSRSAFLGKYTKEIGIAYDRTSHSYAFIAVDKFDNGEEESFVDTLVSSINLLRTNPKGFSQLVNQHKEKKKWITAKYTTILKSLISETAKLKPNKSIIFSDVLSSACNEFMEHAEVKKGIYREEEEILHLRLSHFCSGFKLTGQIVEQGSNKPEDCLFSILTNDRGSENLQLLASEKLKYIGVANVELLGKSSTVIILTDEVKDINRRNFIDEFREDVNHIRVYPKSYIKVFQDIHDNPQEDFINDKITRVKDEALMMVHYLKKSRTYGSLNRNEFLLKAAQARLAMFKADNDTVKDSTQEDLKVFLSDFCSGYNIYHQITSKGFETAREFLCAAMLNIYDNEKEVRNVVFSPKFYNYGIAYDEDSKIVVVILTDAANPPKKNSEPVISRTWQRLQRPTFTPDEEDQLRRDFQSLDTNNQGYIYPNTILIFMNMIEGFKENNPFYYEAISSLNTIENNKSGVTFETFSDAVQKVIKLQTKEKWEELYDNIVKNNTSKKFDYELLLATMKGLNYDYTAEEVKEVVFKISHDGFELENQGAGAGAGADKVKLAKVEGDLFVSKDKFVQIVMSVETNWQTHNN